MIRTRPYVILNAAMTVDGKIATRTGESRLSSPEDLKRVHALRRRVDGIMVGLGTVITDDPKLTVKNHPRKKPVRIIVDSLARIPAKSYVVRTAKQTPTIIGTTARAPKKRIDLLMRRGVAIVNTGKGTRVSLIRLLARLHGLGIRKILLEGGGTLNWSMLKDCLVDEVSVALSPRIVGGREAVSLVDGEGVRQIEDAVKLRISKVKKYGTDLVLSYKVLR